MTKTRKDFEADVSPIQETLEQVKATLRQHFEIKDWQGIELILAVACAHYQPGEMLWFRIIGPSRSGKTELLRAIAEWPDCAKMEHITPASLRGGLRQGPKILKRIDGKLVVTKDLATILTLRSDDRTTIFGLLRPIKDGELVSDFGSNQGYLEQKVKFDWLVATTPGFEQHRVMESLLGERFIDVRWIPGNREEMALKAGCNNPYLDSTIRPMLAADVCSLLSRAEQYALTIDLSAGELRTVSQYADKTARLRTPVQRDRYRNLIAYPEPEIGTDLTQGMSRITKGLKMLEVDFEPYLNRLLWDCMPRLRSQILGCIVGGKTDPAAIATITKLGQRTVDYQLEDLRLLEVIDQNNNICMQLQHP